MSPNNSDWLSHFPIPPIPSLTIGPYATGNAHRKEENIGRDRVGTEANNQYSYHGVADGSSYSGEFYHLSILK